MQQDCFEESRGEQEHEPYDDAVMDYYTRSSGPVGIIIRNASGEMVETVPTTSARGLNRHVFHLTSDTHPGPYHVVIRSSVATAEVSF